MISTFQLHNHTNDNRNCVLLMLQNRTDGMIKKSMTTKKSEIKCWNKFHAKKISSDEISKRINIKWIEAQPMRTKPIEREKKNPQKILNHLMWIACLQSEEIRVKNFVTNIARRKHLWTRSCECVYMWQMSVCVKSAKSNEKYEIKDSLQGCLIYCNGTIPITKFKISSGALFFGTNLNSLPTSIAFYA